MDIWRGAQQTFTVTLYDSTDHVTPKTGVTVTCQVSKDAGTFNNSTNAVSEIGATGRYSVTLTATEMSADRVHLKFTGTGIDQGDLIVVTKGEISGNVNDVTPETDDFDGNAGLSATNDFYLGMWLLFTSGNLKGLSREITDYDGTTKNLVFRKLWPTAAANGDTFVILPGTGFGNDVPDILADTDSLDTTKITTGRATNLDNLDATVSSRSTLTAAAAADAVWDETTSGHVTSDTFGEQCKTDIDAILNFVGTAGVVVAAGSKTGYALTSGERDSIADALLGRSNGVEAGVTPQGALRGILASTTGKSTISSQTVTFYGPDGTTARLAVQMDTNKQRTTSTLTV